MRIAYTLAARGGSASRVTRPRSWAASRSRKPVIASMARLGLSNRAQIVESQKRGVEVNLCQHVRQVWWLIDFEVSVPAKPS